MNSIILTGRWAKDIDLRYLADGTAVAKSTIAVDEGYGDKRKTHFFIVIMWKKTADAAVKYSGKGKKVMIQGRLQQRSWEKDGTKQFAIEVGADQVEFLEFNDGEKKNDDPKSEPKKDKYEHGQDKPIEIDGSDLPF